MTFKNSTRVLFVAVPGTLVAVLAEKLSALGLSVSTKLDAASTKLRAYALRKAAATLAGQAAADEDAAVSLFVKSNEVRAAAGDLYSRARWQIREAKLLREEADDIDPPAPVLAEPEEVSEE